MWVGGGAEDGIRDHCVTGVQTCALPISARDNAKDFERLALWEIHPIYAIDVCKYADKAQCSPANQHAWFPFTELKTWLGLSSVRPTGKCKATTDDPNSKCPGFKLPDK